MSDCRTIKWAFLGSVLSLLSLTALCSSDSAIYSSYRKDYFLSYDHYPEANLPDPTQGGRVHLVGTATATGSASHIVINGREVTFNSGEDPDKWFIDWLHIYPPVLQSGEPVWVSFHTRDKSFDNTNSGSVKITTSDGAVALSGSFPIALSMCNITYITTTTNYSSLLVHVHNGYSSTRTIKTVLVNGSDVTNSVLNKQSLSIPPISSILLVISLDYQQLPGNLITVVLKFAESGATESAAGGRVMKTHFPIESWPKSKECPFPTVNDNNYKFHRDHGIDTLYFSQGSAAPCGGSVPGSDIAGKLAPQHGFYCLINTDVPLEKIENSTNVLAQMISDEGDVKLDDHLRKLMADTELTWKQDPSMFTFAGGSRNRRSGIFSGVADIQGMDMYVAACAPHVQLFLHPPPLRGSYDYLRVTRNNHMPLPTWLYSQLLDDGWDATVGSHVLAHRQPKNYEARIQAMSVIAGCAKGLMYFQSDIGEQKYYSDTWKEIKNFNRDIGAVREYLRQGDCTDMFDSSDGNGFHTESITQVIRSQDALLVPVINVKNDGGINDPGCGLGEDLHWKLNSHTVDSIKIIIPNDFGKVVDTFQVLNGDILDANIEIESATLGKDYYGNDLVGGMATIGSLHLTTDTSTRLFVLANTPNVRTDIKKRLDNPLLM